MSSEIAELESQVKEFRLQLETVQSSLQADPDNAELQALEQELEGGIALLESSIEDLRATLAPPAPREAPTSTEKDKWAKEHASAFSRNGAGSVRGPADEQTPHTSTSYKVNDMVMAKWVTGDKSFYPARITSITGSSAAPVYIVTFKSYNNTETLRASDIRPMPGQHHQDSKKRKADGTPVNSSGSLTPAPPSTVGPVLPGSGSVISAAANIDAALASQVRREPSKVSDGPVRPQKLPKKVKANKELEAGKAKWQEFASKGKVAKGGKKDSMFRTGEGVHARVGFTGSGKEMRKDPTRSRHVYNYEEDEG